jgi:phosphatidylglycerol---prolipoprotein diacylglyceryl transferase
VVNPPLHPWWPDAAPGWLHPHVVFEVLAYAVAFRLFLWLRRRGQDSVGNVEHRGALVAAAAIGGAVGARLLFLFEDPAWSWQHRWDPGLWSSSGRTVVGALLGGWLAVEVAKKVLGVTRSTGDVVVAPLIVGMCIGRLGCFFSGLQDGTHGVPTSTILGMDLGDGMPRHPVMLYELAFLALFGVGLWVARATEAYEGARFRRFLGGYLAFRLVVEVWKTQPFLYGGLSSIQVASAVGLVAVVIDAWRRRG